MSEALRPPPTDVPSAGRPPIADETDSERAAWFVWGVWGAALVAALAFVWTFGADVPWWDEWNMVPIVTGERPVDGSWLWAEHFGHRLPLPKLMLVALYALSGADFRVGMYADVLALGADRKSVV